MRLLSAIFAATLALAAAGPARADYNSSTGRFVPGPANLLADDLNNALDRKCQLDASACTVTPAGASATMALGGVLGLVQQLAYWGVDLYGTARTGAANATKLQSAIEAMPYGGVLHVSRGAIHLDTTAGPILIDKSVVIECDSPFATAFIIDNPATDVFHVTAPNVEIRHCGIQSATAQTAGVTFQVTASDFKAIGNELTGQFQSFSLGTSASSYVYAWIERNIFRDTAVGGGSILVNGYSAVHISHNEMTQSAFRYPGVLFPQPAFGVRPLGPLDTLFLDHNNISQQGISLDISPSTGSVISVKSDHNFYDWCALSGAPNVQIAPSGTANVSRIEFTNDWFGTSNTDGLLINPGTNATVSGVTIKDPQVFLDKGYGIKVYGNGANTNNIRIDGGQISGGGPDGNGNTITSTGGVYIKNAAHVAVTGARVGPIAYYGQFTGVGVQIDTGVDYYIISNVDASGATAAGSASNISLAGGAAHTAVGNNLQ